MLSKLMSNKLHLLTMLLIISYVLVELARLFYSTSIAQPLAMDILDEDDPKEKNYIYLTLFSEALFQLSIVSLLFSIYVHLSK